MWIAAYSSLALLLNHLPLVQLKEYETQGGAAISSRCVTDVETLDNFISQTLSRFLISLLTIIGTAVILLWIDITLGAIILLLNPAVIYFSRQFGKQVAQLKKKENAKKVEAFGFDPNFMQINTHCLMCSRRICLICDRG